MSDKSNNISTLTSTIKTAIENSFKDLHTAMPGIIETFDATKMTVSVQPAIRRIFKTTEADKEILVPSKLPLLINVPILYPRGGGFSLTFPIKKGDECLLVFSERSIDHWYEYGGIQSPGARRFHSLSDAIAFVGLSSKNKVVPVYDTVNTQLKKDDDTAVITIKENSDIDLHSTADITADCVNAVIDASGNIDASAGGSINANASLSANITAPVINLNGTVNISGPCAMASGMAVTGGATNNGKDIGDTHKHNQGPDSAGDSQAQISGVV